MKAMSIEEILVATGGICRKMEGATSISVTKLSISSKDVDEDTLFVPIIGERNDAHVFIEQVYEAGVRVVLSQREDVFLANDLYIIYVGDTKQALQDIATYIRKSIDIPLIGVTGSVGKTTTREMIAIALSPKYKVFKTPANYNSQLGIPLTLSQIADEEIGVIEMGMSEFGEMSRISAIVECDSAVVTNIGLAHIEQLKSKENIRDEKFHIQDAMPVGGKIFLNIDDDILRTSTVREGIIPIYYASEDRNISYYATDITLVHGLPHFVAHIAGKEVKVSLQVYGKHQVGNAILALSVAHIYGVDVEDAVHALSTFTGFLHRQQILHHKGITIIDDTYNASPDSMKVGIDILDKMEASGRKIAVLADMKELGEDTIRQHEEIGLYVNHMSGIYTLYTYGELAANIAKKAHLPGGVHTYMDKASLERALLQTVQSGDVILFKGSNSMKLFSTIEYIMKEIDG